MRLDFDGTTYEPARDGLRLSSQMARVSALMQDSQWRTLNEIAEAVGGSEAGISARLRDLRKPKWGAWIVERRYLDRGVWQYRVLTPVDGPLLAMMR